jgi:uncharacterized membrane protein YdcZ (DUF606 family)
VKTVELLKQVLLKVIGGLIGTTVVLLIAAILYRFRDKNPPAQPKSVPYWQWIIGVLVVFAVAVVVFLATREPWIR